MNTRFTNNEFFVRLTIGLRMFCHHFKGFSQLVTGNKSNITKRAQTLHDYILGNCFQFQHTEN